MATDFENMTVLLLMVLTIACLLQVVFVGVLLWYVKWMADSLGRMSPSASPSSQLPSPSPMTTATVPDAVEAPQAVAADKTEPAEEARPSAPAVEILAESPDIQGSVHRLCEKYDLSDFILTTLDGLVVVSLFPRSSDEAARFSDLYRRKKKPDSPNVTFFEIAHRGEAMLVIVRRDHPLSPEERKGIDEDARKILNWWL
ncbi:MAG: hypothetical protein LUP92_04965 [Methanomicrobiales archaeon]|nr:hypothetical protein [Methanomicrobiales archaeon]